MACCWKEEGTIFFEFTTILHPISNSLLFVSNVSPKVTWQVKLDEREERERREEREERRNRDRGREERKREREGGENVERKRVREREREKVPDHFSFHTSSNFKNINCL